MSSTYLRCQDCRELLPAEAFPVKVTNRSGRGGICLTCRPETPTNETACRWPHKRRHQDKTAALEAIQDLYRHGRGNPDLNVYQCGDHWHIGHNAIHFRKRIKAALSSHGRGKTKARRR